MSLIMEILLRPLGRVRLWFRRASADGHGEGTGRDRTRCGHQNHLPSSAAMDGVMNDRTTSVSNSSPSPIVVPTWPMTVSSLTAMDIIVNANTRPGGRHHRTGAAHRADDARSSARRGSPP